MRADEITRRTAYLKLFSNEISPGVLRRTSGSSRAVKFRIYREEHGRVEEKGRPNFLGTAMINDDRIRSISHKQRVSVRKR